MHKKWMLVALIALIAASVPHDVSYASRGIPGSGEFGYGARLALDGLLVEPALEVAGNLPLDWIAVDFKWSAYAAGPDEPTQWAVIDRVMAAAAQSGVSVMVTIQAAPVWAQTAQGPDPQHTARLVNDLASRYPQTLKAIELFPGANTHSGWGAQPNPSAYTNLFAVVHARLARQSVPFLLVAGGLQPVTSTVEGVQMDDLAYLQGLYRAGIRSKTDIIGLQLCEVTGDPLYVDGQENRVLRHYEQVRQVMLANKHELGVIWVTQLCPPSGTINSADQRYQDPNQQIAWLAQAYTQLRAQLYVGAAFYASLNPDLAGLHRGRSILVDSTNYHPFYQKLRELIAENSPEAVLSNRGRPKNGDLIKANTDE